MRLLGVFMAGSSQYGKGFWSAAATEDVMISGIARGVRGDLGEWPPDRMESILIEGIARGFERWLSAHGEDLLERLEGITIHSLDT
jgi:hypothetical protein